jgi:hypothetical protein
LLIGGGLTRWWYLLKILYVGGISIPVRIRHLLTHHIQRHRLYLPQLHRIHIPLSSIQLRIDYVVYQPFLFEELPVVEKVEAGEYPLEEAAPFHFVVGVFDGGAVLLGQAFEER